MGAVKTDLERGVAARWKVEVFRLCIMLTGADSVSRGSLVFVKGIYLRGVVRMLL